MLLLATVTQAGAFKSRPGGAYVKLGSSLMSTPYAWGNSGGKIDFSQKSAGLGIYGQYSLTGRLGVIVSGNLYSYGRSQFFDQVPQGDTSEVILAGPWSVQGSVHLLERAGFGLGAQAGLSWMFSSDSRAISPHATGEINLGKKLDRIRSGLWADLGIVASLKNDSRPRGRAEFGIKHHDRKWRWELKGLLSVAGALTRSGSANSRIISHSEQRLSADSTFFMLTVDRGLYYGDSFSGAVAGTWYIAKGVGIDLSYRQVFWGRGASSLRSIGIGVSYGWRIKKSVEKTR